MLCYLSGRVGGCGVGVEAIINVWEGLDTDWGWRVEVIRLDSDWGVEVRVGWGVDIGGKVHIMLGGSTIWDGWTEVTETSSTIKVGRDKCLVSAILLFNSALIGVVRLLAPKVR